MTEHQRGFIDFSGLLWALFAAGVLVGALIFGAIPWLWHVMKPLLHRWTS